MLSESESLRIAPIIMIEEPGRQPLLVAITRPMEIGRDCAGLLLGDPSISRTHLVVVPRGASVAISDQDTTNGTSIDGSRLSTPRTLTVDDVVRFGSCTLRLAALGIQPADPGHAEVRATSSPGSESPNAVAVDVRATSIDLVARAALADGAARGTDADVGTMTLVFSDIENSTERAIELGDALWARVIDSHNTVVRRMVERYGGIEVKAQGDGFMLRFKSVRSAITCIASVQRALRDLATSEPLLAVRMRAGIHTGEAVVGDDGDIYGRHVIQAARIAGHARGGEILASSLVHEIVASRGDVQFGPPRTVDLKGIAGRHELYPVRW